MICVSVRGCGGMCEADMVGGVCLCVCVCVCVVCVCVGGIFECVLLVMCVWGWYVWGWLLVMCWGVAGDVLGAWLVMCVCGGGGGYFLANQILRSFMSSTLLYNYKHE